MTGLRYILLAFAAFAVPAALYGQPPLPSYQATVAIIDTGVAQTRRISPSTVEAYDLRDKGKPGLASPHGTMVAGVLVQNLERPVKILSYRADVRCPTIQCSMDQRVIAKSIVHAVDRGANVIQISSYGTYIKDVQKAVAYASSKGVKVVFCAGNEGGQTPLFQTLQNNPDVVYVVGSVSRGQRSSYSANLKGFSDLMTWRRGSELRSWDIAGRSQEVEGTSYAASILTAELLNAYGDHVSETGRAPNNLEWRMRVMKNEDVPNFAQERHVLYDDAIPQTVTVSANPVLTRTVSNGQTGQTSSTPKLETTRPARRTPPVLEPPPGAVIPVKSRAIPMN